MAKRPATKQQASAEDGEGVVDLETPNEGADKEKNVKAKADVVADESDTALDRMKEQLAQARRERDAERVSRQGLQAELDSAKAKAGEFQSAAEQATYRDLTTGLAKAKGEADVAEKAYAEALAAGKFKDAAKHQRTMARLESQIMGYEAVKSDYDRLAESRKHAKRVDDSFEGKLEGAGLSDPVKAWFRKHPDYFTDPVKSKLATAAHWKAIAAGHEVGTDAYFAAAEKELGIDGEAEERVEEEVEETPRQSAPVSRQNQGGGGGGGGKTGKVRLSPEQLDMARNLGMTPVEYAKELQAEVKDGRVSRDKLNYV